MACQYKNKLKSFLEEKLPKEEMQEIEEHLDTCSDCQKELELLLDNPITVPDTDLEIDDATLVKKIKNHKRGIRRITLYAILGFILGIFSRFYTWDKFIVTKAIMALPYKLGEFILGIFYSRNLLPPWERNIEAYHITGNMGFFPYNPILDFIASTITPAIIATFIAIIVAYLISDKTVFRRKKIICFFLAGFFTLCIWLGTLGGLYSGTMHTIEKMSAIEGVTVYEATENSYTLLIDIKEDAFLDKKHLDFKEGISKAEKKGAGFYDQNKKGHILLLHFKGGGKINAFLDPEGTLTLQNGLTYELPESTLKLLKTDILKEGR